MREVLTSPIDFWLLAIVLLVPLVAILKFRSARRQRKTESVQEAFYQPDDDGNLHCVCSHFQAPAAAMCQRCPHRATAAQRDLECWALVLELRDEEASSVEIVADNPDFNGRANCLVVCSGGWTEYEDRDFEGATLLEALRKAVSAKRAITERAI